VKVAPPGDDIVLEIGEAVDDGHPVPDVL